MHDQRRHNPDGFSNNPALEDWKESLLSNTVNATKGYVGMMLYAPEGKAQFGQQTLEESLKFPARECAQDVIPTITLPTLVITAKNSYVKGVNNEWTHVQIAGSRFRLFETAHMMFMEESTAFNEAVMEFIG